MFMHYASDILNEKYKPRILFVYTRRVGFWESSIKVEKMENVSEGELVIEKQTNGWKINLLMTKL